jgi:phosphatidylglycerophosphate synthase
MSSTVAFREFVSLRYAAGGAPATWHFSQRLGALLAYGAQRVGLTPNLVTGLSLLVSLFGVLCFVSLPLTAEAAFFSLILLQLGYGFDCADGQLARASGVSSEIGAWLDNVADLVVMSAMGLGCFCFMFLTKTADLAPALLSAWLFVLAHGIQNYTATRIRISTESRMVTKGWLSFVRFTVTTILDKPVALLLLCAFRLLAPEWLPLLLGFLSAGYVAHALYVGPRLLRQP